MFNLIKFYESKQSRVEKFHALINSPVNRHLDECDDVETSRCLSNDIQDDLIRWSEHFLHVYKQRGDLRALRAHLILEECGEAFRGMGDLDEVKLLDGLGDLDYVTNGTAAAFGLPLDAAFDEIHRSNMTKRVQNNDPDAARCRQKGDQYVPPDLERVLRECRRG